MAERRQFWEDHVVVANFYQQSDLNRKRTKMWLPILAYGTPLLGWIIFANIPLAEHAEQFFRTMVIDLYLGSIGMYLALKAIAVLAGISEKRARNHPE